MAYAETKGSRREIETGDRIFAVKVGVSDDGTGIPAVGDLYLEETGLFGRCCTRVTEDREALPGLRMVRADYEAFVAFA